MTLRSMKWFVRTKGVFKTCRSVAAVLRRAIVPIHPGKLFSFIFLALAFVTGGAPQTRPPSRFIETVAASSSLPTLPELGVTIAVDLRLVLLAVIQSLSDYEERTGLITDLD